MFSLVNNSSYKDLDTTLLANALDFQAQHHWGPAWLSHPPHVSHVAGHAWKVQFVDEDKTVPGALAYHDDPNAIPDAVIMVKTILDYIRKTGAAGYYGPGGVASATAHEILEMLGDLWCNGWWTNWSDGWDYAQEHCDPVEGHDYAVPAKDKNGVTQNVYLSNFILPAWGNNGAPGPYDYMHVLGRTFSINNGYVVKAKAGAETQVTGDLPPTGGYRTMRRLVPKKADQEAVRALAA